MYDDDRTYDDEAFDLDAQNEAWDDVTEYVNRYGIVHAHRCA